MSMNNMLGKPKGRIGNDLPVVSPWRNDLSLSYSASLGTVTNPYFSYRRVGDCMEGRAYFTYGTLSAAAASIQLPAGWEIDFTSPGILGKASVTSGGAGTNYTYTRVGTYHNHTASGTPAPYSSGDNTGAIVVVTSAPSNLYFSFKSASGGFIWDTAVTGMFISSGSVTFDFSIPIKQFNFGT